MWSVAVGGLCATVEPSQLLHGWFSVCLSQLRCVCGCVAGEVGQGLTETASQWCCWQVGVSKEAACKSEAGQRSNVHTHTHNKVETKAMDLGQVSLSTSFNTFTSPIAHIHHDHTEQTSTEPLTVLQSTETFKSATLTAAKRKQAHWLRSAPRPRTSCCHHNAPTCKPICCVCPCCALCARQPVYTPQPLPASSLG